MQAKHPIIRRMLFAACGILACSGVLFASGVGLGLALPLAQSDVQGAINDGASGRADWAWLTATLAALGVMVAGIIARMNYKIEQDRGRREDARLEEHKQGVAQLTDRFIASTKAARDDFRAMLTEERADHRTQRNDDRALFERHHKENADRLDSAILRQTEALKLAIQKRSHGNVEVK